MKRSWLITLLLFAGAVMAAELSDLRTGPIIDRASGFFHTKKANGKWWLVDPLGRAFYMIGTDHVNYGGHYCEKLGYSPYGRNAEKKYGSEEKWIETQFQRLSEWGFNSLPYAAESMRRRKFPHVETLSLGTRFGDVDGLSPKTTWTGFPNVFSPEWKEHCERIAREYCAKVKNDPWVLGYFLDNELEWYGTAATGLFGEAWKRPAGDTAKEAWVAFVKQELRDPEKFYQHWGIRITDWQALSRHREPVEPKTDKGKAIALAFLRHAAELYFKTCNEAIKKYDPNHLIFGCRFASRAPAIWDIAGRYCDVLTFNYYKWIDVHKGIPASLAQELSDWHKQSGKPMMCTEWSFPALDAGLPCLWGGGMRVDTQEQRAQCFTHFQTMLFTLPFIVGSSYFMYIDEPALGISHTFPEDCNYGLLDVNDQPYPAITKAAAELNARVYELHGKGKMPPLTGREKLAKWITTPSGANASPQAEQLTLSAGELKVQGPIDGHAWRLCKGNIVLGELVAYIEQDVGNWLWTPSDAAKIISIQRTAQATVVDMELSSIGQGPLITRLTQDPSKPAPDKVKPGNFRGVWRFVIPQNGGEWISMQNLWFENSDQSAWTSRMSYLFLMPAIGGSREGDKPLYAPDMHFYYVTGAAWIDSTAQAGIGCWYKQQADVECTFWIDRLGRYRSDMRYPTFALLQPGQGWHEPGPIAFFFPLHGISRSAYEQAVRRLESQVLLP